MNFKHPLMYNNITKDDMSCVIKFLKTNPILTQKKNVIEFEKKWSKWLGVKYSVFVNSGSSANFITIAAMKDSLKKKEIITPPLTWPSDIMAVINNGFTPKFVDISLKTLSMDPDLILKNISNKTGAIFLTHAQGFSGLSDKLLKILKKKNIKLIEDVCESHGAKHRNKKLGNYGVVSNFSFYYAHHLSTVEGGMICTNDKKIYDFCIRFRAHGMLRESKFKSVISKATKKHKDLNKNFIFLNPGFNFRNNEIGAVMGINQLKRLDKNITLRNRNFLFFIKNLDKKYFFKDFKIEGISNYAFPIILMNRRIKIRDLFEKFLEKKGIEFRRGNAGGGNQLRQPYLKGFDNPKKFTNTEIVHHYGYYIGNFPDLSLNKIKKITDELNNFFYKLKKVN
jgi:CDP-4-dehydro-6-deoxyglucose reductase, E1